MKMKASYGGGGGDQYINLPYCYFHPEEIVVGVCALCLKERLLELALKQGHNLININIPKAKAKAKDSSSSGGGGGARRSSSRAGYSSTRRKHSFTLLPNVFALPSFLRVVDDITCRQHHQQRRRHHDEDKYSSSSSDHGSITSLEDSFISIKFEDNGEASWGESKKKQKQVELEEEFNINAESTSSKLGSRRVVLGEKSLVEHVIKQRGPGVPLRWRKRIGQLLQLSRWSNYKNKSSKTASGHVGGLVGKVQDHQGRRGWMRSLTTRTSRRRTTGPLAS